MKCISFFLLGSLLTLPLASRCPAETPGEGAAILELSSAQKRLLREACFEVVIPKPEKDSLSYEKALPWDLVDFNIRSDKYISIGTAFAVSSTELLTAQHVLDLAKASLAFKAYYIRDQQQNVYELDKIVTSSEHRDVVRFTVKHKPFERWLELKPEYELNTTVFTAGNAYGEGVMIRRGELTGSLPEEMEGAFAWLKSSADVNPGNSGGPLLDASGRVIGIVVRRKDNICYSLPVKELANLKPSTATFHTKIHYSFALLPGKSNPVSNSFEIALPMPYLDLIAKASQERFKSYSRDMTALFDEHRDQWFPKGEASQEVIQDVPTSSCPEVIYKDQNTDRWTLSEMKTSSYDLGDNGHLKVANGLGLAFLRLIKPDKVPLSDLQSKPRLPMDCILKGINIPRVLGGQNIRITSLGEPQRTISHLDRFGRPWQIHVWLTEFDDSITLLCSTLTPDGMAMLLCGTQSAKLDVWVYDLKKILDFVYVPYTGKLKAWAEFMECRKALPEAFRELKLVVEESKQLKLQSPWGQFRIDAATQEINPNALLGLNMGFVRGQGEDINWALRRLTLSEEESDNYFSFVKHLNPPAQMDERFSKRWKELARQRHPYTQKAFTESEATHIAMLISPATPSPEQASSLCTLYVGRSGTVPEDKMKSILAGLAAGISAR